MVRSIILAIIAALLCLNPAQATWLYQPTTWGPDPTTLVPFNLPSGAFTYAANEAMANAKSGATYLTFPNVCRGANTSVLITAADLKDMANQSLKLHSTLVLFNDKPTALQDGAAWAVNLTDVSVKEVGEISFTDTADANHSMQVMNTGSGVSGAVIFHTITPGLKVPCLPGFPGDTSLYGMMRADNAYIDISSEQLIPVLHVIGVN